MPACAGLRACIKFAINLVGLSYMTYLIVTNKCHASADLEITVPLLVQVDKLVQLIESPVFTCELSINEMNQRLMMFRKTSAFNSLSLNVTPTCLSVYMGYSCCSHNLPLSSHSVTVSTQSTLPASFILPQKREFMHSHFIMR